MGRKWASLSCLLVQQYTKSRHFENQLVLRQSRTPPTRLMISLVVTYDSFRRVRYSRHGCHLRYSFTADHSYTTTIPIKHQPRLPQQLLFHLTSPNPRDEGGKGDLGVWRFKMLSDVGRNIIVLLMLCLRDRYIPNCRHSIRHQRLEKLMVVWSSRCRFWDIVFGDFWGLPLCSLVPKINIMNVLWRVLTHDLWYYIITYYIIFIMKNILVSIDSSWPLNL